MKTKTALILGAGNAPTKRLNTTYHFIDHDYDYVANGIDTMTIDIDKDAKPDCVHDLNRLPWPIPSNLFDEIHAYEILEHFGTQGDFRAFFAHFGELYRVLVGGGILYASCPRHDSVWTFGDPGHTRVINHGSLVFLSRKNYESQVGRTAMTDYRRWLQGDWELLYQRFIGDSFCFALRVIK